MFFVVSAFWKRLIYLMKVGSFPDRLISNTYTCIYNVKSYDYSAALYKTFMSLTIFLAVKKCAYVTMHGGSDVSFLFFLTNRIFILMQVCTFLQNGISGFPYDVVLLLMYVK